MIALGIENIDKKIGTERGRVLLQLKAVRLMIERNDADN